LSRYIKRGARRIGVSRYTDRVVCTAVQNPDGQYAAVLLNAQDEAERVVLNCRYGVHEMLLPAHSITTVLY
jgi:glucosylceramidase